MCVYELLSFQNNYGSLITLIKVKVPFDIYKNLAILFLALFRCCSLRTLINDIINCSFVIHCVLTVMFTVVLILM